MASSVASGRGQILGHPVGLFVLFFTEMWERFSYYGMRALLLLYMTNYFLWSPQDAGQIYKWYTSLVYLTPLLGGFLADKYLGNKWAIIIGGTLMAIGHFAMAFEQHTIFYAALVFLIIGNGFFKPNMSTQVGRLYAVGDPRRDAAYTIFYMGINLGAFLAPLVCGALRETPGFGFHWGFGAAGVGMCIGLMTYLLGLRWVNELPESAVYHDPSATPEEQKAEDEALTEQEAEKTPSAAPLLSGGSPTLLLFTGAGCMVAALLLGLLGWISIDNAVVLGAGVGISSLMSYYIVARCRNAVRDRVLAILIVGVFVIFFWGAFEQAGSAMNIWADKTTNRYVTQTPPPPSEFPEAENAAAQDMSVWARLGNAFLRIFELNPMSTASFQSVNPLAIFLMAPLFAWLWTWLPRRGINISIPAKIALGVFVNGLAFALMIWAVQVESRPSQAQLAELPSGVYATADGRVRFREAPELDNDKGFESFGQSVTDHLEVVNGGRVQFDQSAHLVKNVGVLSDLDRDRMLRASVSKDFLAAIRKLAQDANAAEQAANGKSEFSVSVKLDQVPAGFDLRYSGFAPEKVNFDPNSKTLTSTIALADRDYKMLLLSGADPDLRRALNQIYVNSAPFKVGVWWLIAFYVLCTIGELCLSPVGLSMVSKLAPARFATMLMGMWLLTSFFGNYLAGFAGETWGTVDPTGYFLVITGLLVGASLVCYLLSRWIYAMMHGVR